MKELLHKFKPGISKKYLLFVAAIVWTIAGLMLMNRGIGLVSETKLTLGLSFLIGILGGTIFYMLLFSGISLKHSLRISLIKFEKPCIFSFFDLRSYLMMLTMISGGVILRKSDILDHSVIGTFYIIMGFPLLFSSFRFYYYGFRYNQLKELIEKSAARKNTKSGKTSKTIELVFFILAFIITVYLAHKGLAGQ